ncbi:hypothetical protein ACLBWZ_01400 [Brucellaceae bacterium C25G]
MQRYRFDDKNTLIEALVELLNRGFVPDEMDTVLSRIGPVDLDLMYECLDDIYAYNNISMEEISIAA